MAHDALRVLAVVAVAAAHGDEVRAALQGTGHGHGGVDAVLARGVGTGGDHAALIGRTADGEGLAAQRRVAQFLDGAEERVEIEVQNLARLRRFTHHVSLLYQREPLSLR